MKWCLIVIVSLAGVAPRALTAQTDSSSLHGIVTSGRNPVAGARVIARETGGSFADSTRTDSAGRYSIHLPDAQRSRSFVITVDAPGFAPSRSVVSATAAEHDVVLTSPATALAAVRVERTRERPSIPGLVARDMGSMSHSASGYASSLASSSYSGDVLGFAAGEASLNLAKSAAGRVSAITTLGLGADQTSITVDGADVRSIHVPRDAHLAARVATSLYDPSEGGFSGVKVNITTMPGGNIGSLFGSISGAGNISSHAPGATLTASGGASGYLILDHLMYSSTAEFSRISTPSVSFATQAGTNSSGLTLGGTDATVLNQGLQRFGIGTPAALSHSITNSLSTLNRIDFVADSDHSIALIGRLSSDATAQDGSSPNAIANLFGKRQSTDLGVTLLRTAISDRAAQQTSLAFAGTVNQRSPSRSLSIFQLRVPGSLNGITSEQSVLAGSFLGTASASRSMSVNASHIVRWVTPDGKHKSDAGLTLRVVKDSRDPTSNQFGVVSFDSLAAFASQTPSAYTREFNAARSSVDVGTMSGFVGDLWVLRPHLSMQGGVRFDLNRYSISSAAENAASTSTALGLNGSTTGHSLDASPRIGATWDIPTSSRTVAQYTLHGGVGRFVNDVRSDALLPAALPFVGAASLQRLDCSGSNVPSIDWSALSETNLPTSCSDGTLPIAQNVIGSVIARDWKPAASWRGNIGGAIQLQNNWSLSGDYTHSITTRISSSLAANLVPGAVFTLPSEGGRPVFADEAALSSGSLYGRVIPTRITNDIGSVNYIMSDMRSSANQLVLGAKYFTLTGASLRLSYAYTDARERSRGLDGTTAGDPRLSEWSRSASPAHVIVARAFRRLGGWTSIGINATLQSGMRYTPLVLGDVNGDGRFDDRAYVPAPGNGDSSLSNGIARLLASAPSGARACLRRAVGSFAERNGCTGPWTTSLDAALYTTLGVVSSHRVTLEVEVLNAISGLDALLHGENKMRGWGGYGMADNTLLTETGYNGAQQRFSYAVNPAFGSVRSMSAMENPFGIRVGVSMPLSRDGAEQQLAIDASRRQHPTVANLTDRYVADYPNVGFDILDVADSVGLTKSQRDSLTVIGREFDATMRTIWAPVAERIHAGLTPEASSQIIKAARTPAAINYDAYAGQVRTLLNASQFARLPEMEKWIIEPDALRSMGLAPNAVAR